MYRYIFLFLPLFSLAQNVELNIKKLHKSFVEVKENTFMCKYEVSNYWYSTYLDSTDNERPDSTKWSSNDPTGVMKALYHNHENYQDHPVVNVSRDEAKAFCQWLTDTYHQNEKRKYEKVVFRLPREEEWRDAAYAGLENKALFPFSKESNQLKDKKGRLKANFKFIHDSCIKEENGTIVNLCKDGETIWINAKTRTAVFQSVEHNQTSLYRLTPTNTTTKSTTWPVTSMK